MTTSGGSEAAGLEIATEVGGEGVVMLGGVLAVAATASRSKDGDFGEC